MGKKSYHGYEHDVQDDEVADFEERPIREENVWETDEQPQMEQQPYEPTVRRYFTNLSAEEVQHEQSWEDWFKVTADSGGFDGVKTD